MSIKQSIFEEILIESTDGQRTVDITSGSAMIDYYEDVFSPTITAKIRVINTGSTIVGADSKTSQKQSLYEGLPLRGGERVSIKIAPNSNKNPGLDFPTNSKKYLYVSSITDVISENNRESFTLNLVSREAITNETSRVSKKYSNLPINESVNKILTDVLKANTIGKINQTSNKYSFIGNLRKPFTVLTWLASKSVPYIPETGDATAGFFFYQTVDGFQFRGIDNLNQQKPRKDINGNPIVLIYSEATQSYDTDLNKVDNDFKILSYRTEKNQNLIEKLRLGTYSSNRMFFDPLRHTFSNPIYDQNNYKGKATRLGTEKIDLPPVTKGSDKTLADVPSRIITAVYDIGTLNPGVSTAINSDQSKYQSQALMRYNTLFTQSLSVMIPSNTNLRAGDLIECQFPKITRGDAREYDDTQKGGLYMIKEVCHHFDTRNSYTSLKLIRDTFGIKK